MSVTPDLAPGARARVWILLAVTSVAGALTYWAFGRTEILWIAGVVLAVLLYLLAGVYLRLRFERAELEPVLAVTRPALASHADYWLLIDDGGTVLDMSPAGEAALGEPADVLVGQRLADIVPSAAVDQRVALAELLRFAAGEDGGGRRCRLQLLAEDGSPHSVELRTLPVPDEARRARLIGLAGSVR